jgi:hypothetical protein
MQIFGMVSSTYYSHTIIVDVCLLVQFFFEFGVLLDRPVTSQ